MNSVSKFNRVDDSYYSIDISSDMQDKLPPGMYSLTFIQKTQTLLFNKIKFSSDSILDLPSPEYTDVVSQLEYFMTDEVKTKMTSMGYIYKRSALLHGKPGTGKTIIVNRVAGELVKRGGICLFAEQAALVKLALAHIDKTQPNVLVAVVLEELDSILKFEEKELLYLLDGQLQRDNIMYLATTNYIDKIPGRVKRPGRFGIVRKVNTPNAEARGVYIASKLGQDFKDLIMWIEKTNGLTIDELKEVVQAVYIFKQNLDTTVGLIKELSTVEVVDNPDDDYDYDKEQEMKGLRDSLKELFKSLKVK